MKTDQMRVYQQKRRAEAKRKRLCIVCGTRKALRARSKCNVCTQAQARYYRMNRAKG